MAAKLTLGGFAVLHQMRRSDRQLSEQDAIRVLENAEYGVMSTVSEDRIPYGIPLNFCVIDDRIYFHCATEGHKLDNIAHNANVSFCAVGDTCVLPEQFSTKYESVVVFGTASEVFDQEKQMALEGLLSKYSPNHYSEGLKYIGTLLEMTRVFGISIVSIAGKSGQ